MAQHTVTDVCAVLCLLSFFQFHSNRLANVSIFRQTHPLDVSPCMLFSFQRIRLARYTAYSKSIQIYVLSLFVIFTKQFLHMWTSRGKHTLLTFLFLSVLLIYFPAGLVWHMVVYCGRSLYFLCVLFLFSQDKSYICQRIATNTSFWGVFCLVITSIWAHTNSRYAHVHTYIYAYIHTGRPDRQTDRTNDKQMYNQAHPDTWFRYCQIRVCVFRSIHKRDILNTLGHINTQWVLAHV